MIKYKFLLLISLGLILFFTNNCTLIGVGLATYADDINNTEHYTINEELFSIPPGTDISIITVNDDTLVGIYHSTTNKYSQDYIKEYNDKYNEIKQQLNVPLINDTLVISNSIGKTYKYIFLGFDYDAICVKSTLTDKEDFIKINSDLKFKLPNGQYLDQHWIKNAIEFKTIPILSKMNLENKDDTYSIYYHQIRKINTKSSTYSGIIVLTGITIDLLIVKNSSYPFFGNK